MRTVSTDELRDWLRSPLGSYLLEREQAYYDQAVADVFGFNAVQFGLTDVDFLRACRIPLRFTLGPAREADVRAELCQIPLESNSIDLIVLPHVLEFSANPHQILREVERCLRPEGCVLVSGFNPRSLWGLRRLLAREPRIFPWTGEFISLPRLKDWLKLLGFEVSAGRFVCYAPPVTTEQWLARFGFLEKAGDRWWPISGGVYLLEAIKRVPGMRIIRPGWVARPAAKPSLASLTHKLEGDGRRLTAREALEWEEAA